MASGFFECEFIETNFINCDLDLIAASSVKISNSKQSIQIEGSSCLEMEYFYIFEKSLKDLNLLISTD